MSVSTASLNYSFQVPLREAMTVEGHKISLRLWCRHTPSFSLPMQYLHNKVGKVLKEQQFHFKVLYRERCWLERAPLHTKELLSDQLCQ